MGVYQVNSFKKSSKSNNSKVVIDAEEETGPKTYINIGFVMKNKDDPERGTFVKLPLGINLNMLNEKPIYENMSPEFKAEVSAMNKAIRALKKAAEELEPGEDLSIGAFICQLYKANEAITTVDNSTDKDEEFDIFSADF